MAENTVGGLAGDAAATTGIEHTTIPAVLERAAALPAATLDAQLERARQRGDAVDVDSIDGPARVSTESEEAKLWAQLAEAARPLPSGGAGDLVDELLKIRKP